MMESPAASSSHLSKLDSVSLKVADKDRPLTAMISAIRELEPLTRMEEIAFEREYGCFGKGFNFVRPEDRPITRFLLRVEPEIFQSPCTHYRVCRSFFGPISGCFAAPSKEFSKTGGCKYAASQAAMKRFNVTRQAIDASEQFGNSCDDSSRASGLSLAKPQRPRQLVLTGSPRIPPPRRDSREAPPGRECQVGRESISSGRECQVDHLAGLAQQPSQKPPHEQSQAAQRSP